MEFSWPAIFSFSFLVALTGAMAPGPLMTYTIIRSARASKRGYLMGVWIIAGHAIIEMVIILVLLTGFSFVLKNIHTMRAIGLAGGLLLLSFGVSVVRAVVDGRISTEFLNSPGSGSEEGAITKRMTANPVAGGALISMSNPYWWIWWATIGLAFMMEFNITIRDVGSLSAFFIGHEAGDLIWYVIVSALGFYGIRRMSPRFYKTVLFCCGLFMILFGVYLGISPFFKTHV